MGKMSAMGGTGTFASVLEMQQVPQMELSGAMLAGDDHQMGRVSAWNEERGMGFIICNDGSPDRFVHRTSLADGGSLVVGAQVAFVPSVDPNKGKPIATQVIGAIPEPVDCSGYIYM